MQTTNILTIELMYNNNNNNKQTNKQTNQQTNVFGQTIYRLRFYSNLFIHILLLSNSHNNAVASIEKNRGDKIAPCRVIVA